MAQNPERIFPGGITRKEKDGQSAIIMRTEQVSILRSLLEKTPMPLDLKVRTFLEGLKLATKGQS